MFQVWRSLRGVSHAVCNFQPTFNVLFKLILSKPLHSEYMQNVPALTYCDVKSTIFVYTIISLKQALTSPQDPNDIQAHKQPFKPCKTVCVFTALGKFNSYRLNSFTCVGSSALLYPPVFLFQDYPKHS